MKINNFRDLRVWQSGMDMVERVYCLTRKFPAYEKFGLADQMQRAAVSVPSNIAEGHTRSFTRVYLHHLAMAQSSLAELETQLEITARLKYISKEEFDRILEQLISLARQLKALRVALKAKLTPNS